MRCRPGDLAVITRCYFPHERVHIGKIVQCVCIGVDGSDPIWIVSPQILDYYGVVDSCLTPIRDPGEDAQDETLSWLPVPLPELV